MKYVSWVPWLLFWIIGAVMHHSQGHYMDSAFRYTLFFYVTIAVILFKPRLGALAKKAVPLVASICVLLFMDALVRNPLIIYPSQYAGDAFAWLERLDQIGEIAALALVGGAFAKELAKSKRSRGIGWNVFRVSALAILACVIGGEILVPTISPKPFIDVFVNNSLAVEHFLRGHNPYTQIYPDIYGGFYDYKPGFLYFPGLLYWLAPFRALFGDIRYGYVFANFVIAGGLVMIARKLKAPAALAWLAPILWLSFPVTYFVLEQSWIDTVLIAIAVLVFWSLAERRWLLCGALAGAAFSVKQYGFLVALIAGLEIWRIAGPKAALRAAALGTLVACAAILPFAIADWNHFYASTITAQTTSQVRLDAYNATSYLAHAFHWLIPGWARMGISALGILVGALFVWSRRAPNVSDGAAALLLGYGTAFLFGKFAFCNYHYLLAGLLLLYLVGASGEPLSLSAAGSAFPLPRTSENAEAPNERVGTSKRP